jgi:hypothetical protein
MNNELYALALACEAGWNGTLVYRPKPKAKQPVRKPHPRKVRTAPPLSKKENHILRHALTKNARKHPELDERMPWPEDWSDPIPVKIGSTLDGR